MDFAAFRKSVTAKAPPAGVPAAIAALWWDAKGDWDQAHKLADSDHDHDGSWVHAYLHRKEGDRGNASYWYRRAGKPVATGTLEAEWTAIAKALLARG